MDEGLLHKRRTPTAAEAAALPAARLPEGLRRDRFDYRQDFVVDSSRIRAELGYAEQIEFD